jgi:hypothetical protein
MWGLPPDEEVVEGEQALTVVERGVGHGHLAHPVITAQDGPDRRPSLLHPERYEDAINGRRIRVEGQDRLRGAQIFGDIDDHAVRPEGHDEVPLPERERGKKRALDVLPADTAGKGRIESGEGLVMGALFLLIRFEGYA